MIKSIIKVLLFIGIFSTIASAQLNANDFKKFQLKALKKADKFGVFVWDIEIAKSDTTLAKSFASDTLINYIDSKLTTSGLTPVTFDEAGDLPGGPSLDVHTVTCQDTITNKVACNISVRFVQDVQLTRNVRIMHYSATTWMKNNVFVSEKDSLISNYYFELDKLLEDFVEDYKSAN